MYIVEYDFVSFAVNSILLSDTFSSDLKTTDIFIIQRTTMNYHDQQHFQSIAHSPTPMKVICAFTFENRTSQ